MWAFLLPQIHIFCSDIYFLHLPQLFPGFEQYLQYLQFLHALHGVSPLQVACSEIGLKAL